MMSYTRLTKKGGLNFADENLSLVDEWGYSHIYKRLAEYEDDEESGKIVRLPCKVGDTVYRIRKKPYKAVLERFVVSITLCLNYKGQFEWRLFTTTEDTLGKTVFLTREEAENRLKEIQE